MFKNTHTTAPNAATLCKRGFISPAVAEVTTLLTPCWYSESPLSWH